MPYWLFPAGGCCRDRKQFLALFFSNHRPQVAITRRSAVRMPALILAVVAATLLTAPASPQDRATLSRKDQQEESARKLKELQKERLATLKDLAAVATKLFQSGRVEHQEVIEA